MDCTAWMHARETERRRLGATLAELREFLRSRAPSLTLDLSADPRLRSLATRADGHATQGVHLDAGGVRIRLQQRNGAFVADTADMARYVESLTSSEQAYTPADE